MNNDILTSMGIFDGVKMYHVGDGESIEIGRLKADGTRESGHAITPVSYNSYGVYVRSWNELWFIPYSQLEYYGHATISNLYTSN